MRTGIWVVVMCLLVIGSLLIWIDNPLIELTGEPQRIELSAWLLVACLIIVFLEGVFGLFGRTLAGMEFVSRRRETSGLNLPCSTFNQPEHNAALRCKAHLRANYNLFWRRKVRLLLIIGEPDQIEAIAPGLAEKRWLEGHDTVLLWGGSASAKPEALFKPWRGLSRWRALDGVVWALTKEQSTDVAAMYAGTRNLQALSRELGWQLPLHLWQVCASEWSQSDRPNQPVGCVLPSRVTPEQLEARLAALEDPLRQQGLTQMQEQMGHDFLFRLSYDLKTEGIARWRKALSPLLGVFASVPLRGLWFSLPLQRAESIEHHIWPQEPNWLGAIKDKTSNPRRLGGHPVRVGQMLLLTLAALWGAGMLLSFVSNRAQILQVQTALAAVQQPVSADEQLLALNELMRELARLDYRAEHGVPLYQRFGLNQNQVLLDALWPRYIAANQQLIRDPAAANLHRQLSAWVKLTPDNPHRANQAPAAYEQLKAYLMMARPDKVDAAFLNTALSNAEPTRAGFEAPGLWQALSPGLLAFYTEQLPTHPEWRIKADPALIAQVRRVLLGQLGQRNAEANLYQQVLDAAANQAKPLNLHDMVGDTDALSLLSSTGEVPGVFTRQAWEGHVSQAIDEIAEARREQIDWVLSDSKTDIAAELTPDVLKQRLTERYFEDYSSAWLAFLNGLRWQPPYNLADVIDQLALMSDVRQSPVIALMNTLAYQGQAGTRELAMTDSLIQSAQQLIKKDITPVTSHFKQSPSGPLDATFGPLLALMGKAPEDARGDDNLSLQAFLTRVTRVRLKLQQISNAPDPQEMTQALAQTVFQGQNVDLTDTQAYGRLIAASLGAEWGSVGNTLFVQPLDQAWQKVLQPSAASLNKQWQRSIVTHWDGAFTGRYPFAATTSDVSLPMLGQMIRADSGRIEQFLQQQLSGVIRKEGSQWVADTRHSQGLRLNPKFLAAINQLSHLADVLYTDGGMGLSFELSGKAARDVVQTTFILNGEKHEYFNQREKWQRFNWPGRGDYPGARLSWISVKTGERLYGDYQGTWGLIRLLEQAQMTLLDDGESRYRMIIKAPDDLSLTWNLRTEMGAGPLELLKLRGFKLPKEIFLSSTKTSEPYAQNGGVE
ncbi:type VI secretion protein VasK [Pseudomonas sp. S25]|uniref:Type VI secretion protein VasK n=1 Tax=Pseudomonas maioricensis TaxID=1766623 RepID=A0ABS9ZFH3_9PSED|nr:ImcF-related family protein [Pseudomonas sp. S25]MCI8208927.1 type VI secretion protein VasK [Pseudomonas sp. S25]